MSEMEPSLSALEKSQMGAQGREHQQNVGVEQLGDAQPLVVGNPRVALDAPKTPVALAAT